MELRNEPNVRQEQNLIKIVVVSAVVAIVLGATFFIISNLAPSSKTLAANDPTVYEVSGNVNASSNTQIFDNADNGDTIKVFGSLKINSNSSKLKDKHVIVLVDGGTIEWNSKKYFKLGSNAKILLTNGGQITATSGNQDKASSIYFGSTKKASYTGEQASVSFADVNTSGGVQLDGLTALPVELIKFEALFTEEGVHLNWATASEINNSHFDIEKSINGKDWEKIGTVQGNGNSQKIIKYEYTDLSVIKSGNAYYRLKQVDFDGAFEYSFIRSVVAGIVKKEIKTSIYPNPANAFVNATVNQNEPYQIVITDLSGNVKYQAESSENTETISTTELPSGIYYISFTNDGMKESHKLIVRH